MENAKPGFPSAPPAATPEAASAEVGYGRPPAKSRFKPGRSGNPKGRPKGSRNARPASELDLAQIILEAASETHEFQQGGRTVTLTRAKAVVESISVKAIKGDHRSQKLFVEMTAAASEKRLQQRLELFGEAVAYKQRAEDEIRRRRAAGLPISDILPHPDDIVLEPGSGSVRFKGPVSAEEYAQLKFLLEREEKLEAEVAEIACQIAGENRRSAKRALTKELQIAEKAVDEHRGLIDQTWPDAHITIEQDVKTFGRDLVDRIRLFGQGRPPRRLRGFHFQKRREDDDGGGLP